MNPRSCAETSPLNEEPNVRAGATTKAMTTNSLMDSLKQFGRNARRTERPSRPKSPRSTHDNEPGPREGRTAARKSVTRPRIRLESPQKRRRTSQVSMALKTEKDQLSARPDLNSDEADSENDDAPPAPTVTKIERAAQRRNRQRVERRDRTDETTLRKYLPAHVDMLLGDPIPGPDDIFNPPNWLLEAVTSVANRPPPTPTDPLAQFTTTTESLRHNEELLKANDYDLQRILQQSTGTTMDPNAEFRPIHQLDAIFKQHPHYPFVRQMVTHGMDYHFETELTEAQRVLEMEANLVRGNHKSATSLTEHLTKLLARDVKFGFALPVPTTIVPKLKHAMVQPAGLASQFTLKEDGSRVKKQRLTHDLSFSITDEQAGVNQRIDMQRYPEMIYGWCLLRVIHYIVALRDKYPDQHILIAKYDFSDAYRRVAHTAKAAAQTILALNGIAYIMLRLAFGGSPNPAAWCGFSEMVTDLANELQLCLSWEPEELHSPAQPTSPAPTYLPTEIPFEPARPTAVQVPVTVTARTDSFIDDLILVFLDTADNRRRSPHTVPLAVHVANRPHAGDQEALPRRENISEPKLKAEGTPAEQQIVLGWELQTRQLVIRLPADKFIAWTADISDILRTKSTTTKDLESCVGRLNHVAFVIPLSRHFLSRLYRRIGGPYPAKQRFTLNRLELDDLLLWLDFLQHARQGIPLNLITHRRPTNVGVSDSCPYGLGGFTWSGQAWRLQIPSSSPLYGADRVNNALELLAMVITLWLMVLDAPAPHACLLALGDSTSAIGWLYRSAALGDDSIYTKSVTLMSRQVAQLMIQHQHCLFSQHLPGSINIVADQLSFTSQMRDGKPNLLAHDEPCNHILTQRFHHLMPQLIPENFKISQLPAEILSFAVHVLQTMESSMMPSVKRHSNARTEPGDAGSAFAKPPASISHSSIIYPSKAASSSCVPSSPVTVLPLGPKQDDFLASIRDPYRRRLSEMPQATWLRRFGTVSGKAPFTSRGAPSCSHR